MAEDQTEKQSSVDPIVLEDTKTAGTSPSQSVFISYATEDLSAAQQLRAWLVEEGHDAFLAHEAMQAHLGEAGWSQHIDRALDRIPILIVLMSDHALQSRWVEYEWRSVHLDILEKATRLLIPIWVHASIEPRELPRALKGYQAFEATRGLDRGAATAIAQKVQAFLAAHSPIETKPVAAMARRGARGELDQTRPTGSAEPPAPPPSEARERTQRRFELAGLAIGALALAIVYVALAPSPGGVPQGLTTHLYQSASRLVLYMDNLHHASDLYVQDIEARDEATGVARLGRQRANVESAAKPYNAELAEFQGESENFGRYVQILATIDRESRFAPLEKPTRSLIEHVRGLDAYALSDATRLHSEVLRRRFSLGIDLGELKERKLGFERAVLHQAAFDPPDCLDPGPAAGFWLGRLVEDIRRRRRQPDVAPAGIHTARGLLESHRQSLLNLEKVVRTFQGGPVYTADSTEAVRVFPDAAMPLRKGIKALNSSFQKLSDRRMDLIVELLQYDPSHPVICTLQRVENYQWLDLQKSLMPPLTAIIAASQQPQVDNLTINDIRSQRKDWDAVLASIAKGIALIERGDASGGDALAAGVP